MERTVFNYESMLRWRAEWLERQMQGKLLVKSNERDFEASRQGLLKRYVTFDFTPDTALINWSVFLNDVREHSGRHKHQGGLALFVIEGRGSMDIDGTSYPWKRGDLITLPIRPGGIEHQHFNAQAGEPCRWVAFYYRPFEDWVCHTMTHIKDMTSAAPSRQSGTEEPAGTMDPSHARLPGFFYHPDESKPGLFDSLLALRDAQRKLRGQVSCVRGGDQLPWELNRHGIMRWYLHPLFLYTGLRNFSAYLQYLPPGSRSGKEKHPGDKVFFVVRGKGHTVIDGESHSWGNEDLLMLPIRPNGATYQHFNDDPQTPAFLFACEPNLAFLFDLDRGSAFEELEEAPEFRAGGPRASLDGPAPSF